ncbi:MAG: hypothetical protein ACPG6P_13565 [Akkermansiaceae bacterium]
MKQLPIYLAVAAIQISLSSFVSAEGLADDVKKIQQQGSPKVLRCVLNKRPRCLAIQLSADLAVAYDTWRGGLIAAWKPSDPKKPFKLDGAVFTGRHGPQPTMNGQTYFFSKEEAKQQYSFSDETATMHYLGHKIGKDGLVTLQFVFRDAGGKPLAALEDVSTVKNGTLFRKLTVSGMAEGGELSVHLPDGPKWSENAGGSVVLKANEGKPVTKTISAKLR